MHPYLKTVFACAGLACVSVSALSAQAFEFEAKNIRSLRGTTFHAGQKTSIAYTVLSKEKLTAKNVRISVYLSRDAKITTSDHVLFRFEKTLKPVDLINELAFGLKIPETWPAGTSYIGVFVDDNQRFPERNENDNIDLFKCTVKALADLRVDATVKTNTPRAGDVWPVTVTVKNHGNVTVGNSFLPVTGLFLGTKAARDPADLFLGAAPMLIAPGKSVTVTLRPRLPAHLSGLKFLHVIADYDGKIPEYNETNNVRNLAPRIQPIARTAARVEFLPRHGTIARSVDSARVLASRGGKAGMSVVAPEFAFGDYLCLWSRKPILEFDAFTSLSLALLNGPIMPRWLGRLDQNGHAFPAIALPGMPRITTTIYTHALFRNVDRTRLRLTTNATRLSIVGL